MSDVENIYYNIEVAINYNTSPEILANILRRGNDDEVSWCAVQNKNCPSEALAEVLRRGNHDEVSWYAEYNINCPPVDKIRWMRLVGLIAVEDPSKGDIVEYDEEKTKIDEDLEKIKRMVGL